MEAIKGSFIKSHPLEIVTNQQGKKIGMLFAYLSQLSHPEMEIGLLGFTHFRLFNTILN